MYIYVYICIYCTFSISFISFAKNWMRSILCYMHLYVLYQKQVSFPNPKMSHRNIPRNLLQPTSSPQALRVEVWTWRPPPSPRSFPGIASGIFSTCFMYLKHHHGIFSTYLPSSFYTYVFEYLAHVGMYLKTWHLAHSFWHTFWQIFLHSFWHSIWHLFRHSFGHSFWHLFWHSLWHFLWHSIW